MAKMSKQWLTVTLVAVPVVLAAIGLTVLRAPNATVEGYGDPIGISRDAPAASYAAAVGSFPIALGDRSFTASELGVELAATPEIPRAWSFGDWGRDFSAPLKVDEAKRNSVLSGVEGYGAAKDGTVIFDGTSWVATAAAPGLELSEDLPKSVENALREGKSSLTIELKEFPPVISTETAQGAADKLNGSTLDVYAGHSKVASLGAKDFGGLISVERAGEELKPKVNQGAVAELAESYSLVKQAKVDGQVMVGDDGTVLKTIEEPKDGFEAGSKDAIAAALESSLASVLSGDSPQKFEIPGTVDAAQPATINRSAVISLSEHTAYFYENGKEVARFPIAVGKPGYETIPGTFKVYAQLRAQNMGACDANGNLIPGRATDYCVRDVPWVSYFNGDQGLHGAPWHNNFGNPNSNLSHGCVNFRPADAEWTYRFLEIGSTVTVRA